MTITNKGLIQEVRQLLLAHPGVDLSGYREETLSRRIAARQASIHATDTDAYLQLLADDLEERQHLLDTIGVQVSSFFRNPETFDFISKELLPEMVRQKRNDASSMIRAWSAGCAGGEEAYTLAILLKEALLARAPELKAMVFATDVNAGALKKAEIAEYDPRQLAETPMDLVEKYFTSSGGKFKVTDQIRRMVSFSWDDLTTKNRIAPKDSVFGGFDLVTCRNVFIYYDTEVQMRVLDKINSSLNPGGYLILGDSEGFNFGEGFDCKTVSSTLKIWQKS
jgi:chemotaxis methyl-accepting protein methylase